MSVVHTPDNLIAGLIIPQYKVRIPVANGTYSRGDALQKTGGIVGALATASNFYAVAAEDKVVDAQNTKLLVYLSGQFTTSEVNFGSVEAADVVDVARGFQIYFE
ncbi:MAG: hypothetical protein LBQ97_02580 [Fusobacteriaceae bacterium]|jgi:hypothetical protein|nr:hypothetical protein [Fusobacteriaceae bacterium]